MFFNKKLGAVLLTAGTCIGAGMLALPISTAPLGFWLAGLLVSAIGVLMMVTGLYTAEVNAWFPGNISFITMAEKTLGPWGKKITWCLFLFLLYALVAAYLAGGAALTIHFFTAFSTFQFSQQAGLVPWVVTGCCLIYLGTRTVDLLNKALVLGLVVSYSVLILVLWPHTHAVPHHFIPHSGFIWVALPIILTSYGYHIVIPSIHAYLDQDAAQVRRTILLGCAVAIAVYLLWMYLVFRVINDPAQILGAQSSDGLARLLSAVTAHASVTIMVSSFVFFALSTSFVGVALGLFHLIADGLRLPANAPGNLMAAVLTFVPPLGFAVFYPQGFVVALSYAGFIVALLHGVLPVWMAWRGRYTLRLSGAQNYRVIGGKGLLILTFFLCVLVIVAALAGYCGWQPHA